MSIEYEAIDSKHIGRYADLALEEQLHRAKYKNVITACAFIREEDKKRAAGLIQFAKRKEGTELLWIYVSDEKRGLGIGKGLLKYMFDTMGDNIVSRVCVRIPFDLKIDFYADTMSEFLINHGFNNKEVVTGDWSVTGRDVFLENFKLGKKQQDALFKSIVSFRECTPAVIEACARALKTEDDDSIRYADKALSFIYESAGTYKGMIWTNKIGDALYPEGLVFSDENVRDRLLAVFFLSYSRNIHYADRVIVRDTEITREWMPKLFPESSTKKTILLTT
jgi:GNAT superfamily N-acetyltransferase